MENRIIHAFVYALSGAVLGLILIPVWGLFINTQTSPVSIVLASSLFFAIWGFLFPNSVKNVFMYLWNFFKIDTLSFKSLKQPLLKNYYLSIKVAFWWLNYLD
ncbi:hypothetical protein [Acinetobacter sp. YH16051]|uniref:hypothetical protein n=1 Tax=Acinetobacter sp. YH16051 TaxID=2601190 RepID=UPI00211E6FAC|nr:hypothetical protein [Acinetobacter sp. YH16051]